MQTLSTAVDVSQLQFTHSEISILQIIPVDNNTFPLAEKFIKPYEERCIFLASYIRRKDPNIYFLTKNNTQSTVAERQRTVAKRSATVLQRSAAVNQRSAAVNSVSFNDIIGVLYIDKTIFHCIPDPSQIDKASLTNRLCSLLASKGHQIKCISGEAQTTRLIVQCLVDTTGEPYQTNHYNLMTVENVVSPLEELCNGDEILRCSENDLEELFPIQKMYMNEEVATYGRKVSDAEVTIGLRQILKNQLCLALQSDGEIVAKANTNAIGINWIQLGGIYTHPLYRRNGYAWQLISAICRRTSKAGKKTALFVKDINVPAMELYKKLGFTNSGQYEICYY